MKPEYREGPEALENFERLATKVFRSPKPEIKPEVKAKKREAKARSRKPKKTDKD